MNIVIISLILTIAGEVGIPPNFALAVALTENSTLNPNALHLNANGTTDFGIMMLNSSWFNGDWQDPETNIRTACILIKNLYERSGDWWQVAIAYNCGHDGLMRGPPKMSIEYAFMVFQKWYELDHLLGSEKKLYGRG